jgi:DNA-binding transcriptional regulator YiaG
MTPKQIKRERDRRKLSQEAFAQLIGVSAKTVARWESGESSPSRMALEKLNAVREEK